MIDYKQFPMEPLDLDFVIPADLLHKFEKEVRIVVKFPWIVGIPVPEYLFKDPEIFSKLDRFEVMLVPKVMK